MNLTGERFFPSGTPGPLHNRPCFCFVLFQVLLCLQYAVEGDQQRKRGKLTLKGVTLHFSVKSTPSELSFEPLHEGKRITRQHFRKGASEGNIVRG